MSNLASDVVK